MFLFEDIDKDIGFGGKDGLGDKDVRVGVGAGDGFLYFCVLVLGNELREHDLTLAAWELHVDRVARVQRRARVLSQN